MNDISSADNLFETMLEAAYFRLGQENWTPCYIASDKERPRSEEIERLVASFNYPCVIFLNARETPGANTLDPNEEPPVHGWLDKRRCEQSSQKRSDYSHAFCDLIHELCERVEDAKGKPVPNRRISVVLLCRQFDQSPLRQQMCDDELDFKTVELKPSDDDRDDTDAVTAAITWAGHVAAKQRFLHALVLMQRPRPLATIWTPAASVPGDEVIDDQDRLNWLNELEKIGLIRRKAGGFIWIHSRSREGLRKALHSREAMEKTVTGSSHDWSPWEDEPVIHSRLADWYGRILDSSGAPAAAFEVAYHFCRAADCELLLNRLGSIAWAAERIVAARSFLRTHRFLVQTRGYSRECCRRLEHIRRLSLAMRRQAVVGGVAANELIGKLDRLTRICTEIMRAIAREVGEDSKAYQRHRELALLCVDPTGDTVKEIEQDAVGGAITKGLSNKLHAVLLQRPRSLSWLQWLRWWRWLGMLGIASRSFEMAESALIRALHYATSSSFEYEFDRKWNAWATLPAVQPPERNKGRARVQELRIEVLRVAEQYVALQLLKQSVRYRSRTLTQNPHRYGSKDQENDRVELQTLSEIDEKIGHSLELAAAIRDHDDSPGSYDTVTAVWCQSRLLMHRSACKMRRLLHGDNKKHQIPQTAIGLLGDAEACLRVADPQRHRSDLALVDLYRGEARLCRAESMALDWGDKDDEFPCMTLGALCRHLEALPKKTNREVNEELPWLRQPPKNLRQLQVLIADALRFFARAELVLRERRRNVWWTTWFFERKLRAIAASVWLSLFELRAPIPFLGFEASASGVDTAADSLLDIGVRMIRVDAYRLATIVEAYASCAKALHLRLRLDDAATENRYFDRQANGRRELVRGLKYLKIVLEARTRATESMNKAGMDADVAAVVAKIQTKVQAIADVITPVSRGAAGTRGDRPNEGRRQ